MGLIFGRKRNGDQPRSDNGEMSFLQHLEELRWHLMRSAVAVLIGAVFIFSNINFIFDHILFAPKKADFITNRFFAWLGRQLGTTDLDINTKDFQIINIDLAGQFSMHINIAIVGGIIIAIPFIFYEFWSFIKPALYEKERKYASGAVFYTSFLFLLGASFGYFLVVPLTTHFFGSYSVSTDVTNQINITSYISSVNTIVLGGGVVFELPIIIYFLSKVGLMSPKFLTTYRRHAYILLLLLAAIITPPDVFSMMLVTAPLVILYEVGILLSKGIERKRNVSDLLEA